MSQLFAAFGIDWRLLIINLVNFALLLVLLRLFLYKPLLAMLEKRREEIAQGVENARLARENLAQAEAEKLAKLTEAASEAETMIAEARKSAGTKHDTIVKGAEAAAAGLVDQATREAEELKRKMIEDTKADVAKLIVLGAAKVVNAGNASTK